jgi:transposase
VADPRLHRHPGAPARGRQKRGQRAEALGRSRGGFSTKLHIAVDGLGNPVELALSPGQQADITCAPALLGDHRPGAVIADKGYDSAALVGAIEARGAEAVIPAQKDRKAQRAIDRHLYKERNQAERFINRVKHYRRVATRYDKTDRNYLAFVHVAAVMVLLR